jgi:hypothetical protein
MNYSTQMTVNKMLKNKQSTKNYGDEASTAKDFLLVLIVLVVLVILSWLAYYKLHLFH